MKWAIRSSKQMNDMQIAVNMLPKRMLTLSNEGDSEGRKFLFAISKLMLKTKETNVFWG
jgi:hypothetical protein